MIRLTSDCVSFTSVHDQTFSSHDHRLFIFSLNSTFIFFIDISADIHDRLGATGRKTVCFQNIFSYEHYIIQFYYAGRHKYAVHRSPRLLLCVLTALFVSVGKSTKWCMCAYKCGMRCEILVLYLNVNKFFGCCLKGGV